MFGDFFPVLITVQLFYLKMSVSKNEIKAVFRNKRTINTSEDYQPLLSMFAANSE
jgi:hypothetical protein